MSVNQETLSGSCKEVKGKSVKSGGKFSKRRARSDSGQGRASHRSSSSEKLARRKPTSSCFMERIAEEIGGDDGMSEAVKEYARQFSDQMQQVADSVSESVRAGLHSDRAAPFATIPQNRLPYALARASSLASSLPWPYGVVNPLQRSVQSRIDECKRLRGRKNSILRMNVCRKLLNKLDGIIVTPMVIWPQPLQAGAEFIQDNPFSTCLTVFALASPPAVSCVSHYRAPVRSPVPIKPYRLGRKIMDAVGSRAGQLSFKVV